MGLVGGGYAALRRLAVPALNLPQKAGHNRDKPAASNGGAQIRHVEICLQDQGLQLRCEEKSRRVKEYNASHGYLPMEMVPSDGIKRRTFNSLSIRLPA